MKNIVSILKQVCAMSTGNLIDYLSTLKGARVDKYDNVIINTGKDLPCIVAHTDTVHVHHENDACNIKILNISGNLIAFDMDNMSQVGTGGDDRCGVAIALMLFHRGAKVNYLFPSDEEIGGIGSSRIDDSDLISGYYVQCDRRGGKDIVFNISGTRIASNKFKKTLRPIYKRYGYSDTVGMFTDVLNINRKSGMSCINLSCGYYDPHMNNEYIKIDDIKNTFALVSDIVTNVKGKYPHMQKREYYNKWSKKDSFVDYSSVWINTDKKDETINDTDILGLHFCDYCGQNDSVKWVQQHKAYLCATCITYLYQINQISK